MPRNIGIVTGTRAEYGLLYWLMWEVHNDPHLELQVIVTGAHLSPEFGRTYRFIENDGFPISAKIEMLLSSDTPTSITKSMGLGLIGFADTLERLKPDILVVFGDRYEMLVAAQAAMVAQIPIAHIHGGETTEGAIDEAIRHALTKMAHLHFVAADPYRHRVIQLGETPERVFNFGAPGLDHIQRLPLLDRPALEQELDFKLGALNFLVTYHPVTLGQQRSQDAIHNCLNALDQFPESHIIFTQNNADAEGRIIGQMVEKYVAKHPKRMRFYSSLGQLKYLSTMQQVDVVVGNSSSGLIEAPTMKKPTVNIGPRQKGRLRAASVIDCHDSCGAIVQAMQKALSAEFQSTLSQVVSPYGMGNASHAIKTVLKDHPLEQLLYKKFYNLAVPLSAN